MPIPGVGIGVFAFPGDIPKPCFVAPSRTRRDNQNSSNLPPRLVGSLQRDALPKLHYRGADRDRTDDLFVANEALSQLSYSPGITLTFLLSNSTPFNGQGTSAVLFSTMKVPILF